jgi:predicted DNA binding protein
MYYDEYFSKIANETFNKGSNPQDKKERELIERIQKFNDGMAMMQLVDEYKGIINTCITESGITSAMDYSTAYSYATAEFRKIIRKNIDLNKQKGKISSSVFGFLKGELMKRKNENMNLTSRMSTDLQMKANYIGVADEALKRDLGRIGTAKETHDYITNIMKKNIRVSDIGKIRERTRKELSGDQQVGGTTEGADFITLSDLKNTSKTTPEDEYKKFLKEQQLEILLNKFSKKEKRIIMNALGIGEFKNKKAKNINELAINNGITHYEASKILKKYDILRKSELKE